VARRVISRRRRSDRPDGIKGEQMPAQPRECAEDRFNGIPRHECGQNDYATAFSALTPIRTHVEDEAGPTLLQNLT
jgi:hypothetical protein